MASRGASEGQASVELVAVLPALALLALAVWQLVAVAHGALVARSAARAGERASEVGLPAAEAARAVLPASLARDARIETGAPGGIRLRVRIPAGLPGTGRGLEIATDDR